MLPHGSRFYFSKLSDGEKDIYNSISDALDRFEQTVSIRAGIGRLSDIQKIFEYILLDNPGFFYLDKRRFEYSQSFMSAQIRFQYDYTRSEAEQFSSAIKEKISAFMRGAINRAMGHLEKQRAIHKYLQAAIKPEYENISRDSHSVVGALVHGFCVCEGFAKAYKLLCDYVKLAAIVVTGESDRDGKREPHAWNIVRINNITAHNDITWDAIAGIGSYTYFNLCDAEISADHSFEAGFFPVCVPNKINYFYLNRLTAANEAEARRIIAANADKAGFSMKFLFPVELERIMGFGFPSGSFKFNDAQNVVTFMKTK